MDESTEARFWAKVDDSSWDGCWVWTGTRNPARGKAKDYGRFSLGGRMVYAHRFSWELHFGPIPEGMKVLHRCDNPPCVRPDHLFLGTQLDNMRDRDTKGRGYRPPLSQFCGRGHLLDEANAYIRPDNGQRMCRECRRFRRRHSAS